MEGIEYHDDRKLDKAQLSRFATCDYIDEEHHIILKGATGNGKTYIACALGNAACRKFKSVRYVRMPELLDELTIARAENMFRKVTWPGIVSLPARFKVRLHVVTYTDGFGVNVQTE